MSFHNDMRIATRSTFQALGAEGSYLEGAGPAIDPVLVIVNIGVAVLGEMGEVVGRKDQVKLLVEDVVRGKRNAIVTSSDHPGKQFKLVSLEYTDGFYERWNVGTE